MPSQSTNAGIVTNEDSGERQIPESLRADGTTRKAIKIRPGYRPPEDVEVYKNRTAEAFRDRGRRIGIPGAAGLKEDLEDKASTAASNKNAKRREARKKAKAAAHDDAQGDDKEALAEAAKVEELNSEVEREKKARNLKKKLKQARELKSKKEGGGTLLPEQIAKVIKINELVRELDALGFGTDGENQPLSIDGRPQAAKKTET
ncbi:Exon junction complex, Pym [Moelleriella libera RCEF 2490]|uniref:Exon junction complex, Pym n=1 Tax=Moelleriella libera RCEF 2490 TaxID=1081109 RepID=A0A168C184_9HYPO|nr:Exon junction complex, Pym [Moelleriella libera RCEF 2490]